MGDLLDMKIDFKELEKNIKYQKQWLNDKHGLNMPVIMDVLLDRFKSNLSETEIQNFFNGLEILKLTDYPNIDKKYKNSVILHGDIRKYGKIIRSADGGYDFLNKLDTNYSKLSFFICYLLKKMLDDDNISTNDKGLYFYNKIKTDLREGLIEFRNEIIDLANNYLISIDDYRNIFVDNLIHLTNVGDYSESLVRDYLLNNGFKIVYSGGNGDFIDKIYGIDFIGKHPIYGYKTFQVKHNQFDLEKTFGRYKRQGVNIGIVANKNYFKVYDLQNDYKEFDIFNNDYILGFLELKHKVIKYEGLDIAINQYDKNKLLHARRCSNIELIDEIYNIEIIYSEKITKPYICFLYNDTIYAFKNDYILETETDDKTYFKSFFKIDKKNLIFEEII